MKKQNFVLSTFHPSNDHPFSKFEFTHSSLVCVLCAIPTLPSVYGRYHTPMHRFHSLAPTPKHPNFTSVSLPERWIAYFHTFIIFVMYGRYHTPCGKYRTRKTNKQATTLQIADFVPLYFGAVREGYCVYSSPPGTTFSHAGRTRLTPCSFF